MASIKINNADMKRLNDRIEKMKLIDKKILGAEIGKAALLIDGKAKRNIASAGFTHSRGKLKEGQKIEPEKKNTKKVMIFNDKKYAPYIEFGTRHKTIKLDDMLELGIPASYAEKFKANPLKKPSNVTAKPFFFSAVRVGFKSLLDRLEMQIKKSMK